MWARRRRQARATLAKDLAEARERPRIVRRGARPPARTFIAWTALAMMTVGSVGYLGSTPAMSVFGLASVFLYVLPALVFLLPVSLVAARTGLGLAGRRLQLGARGIPPDGAPRRCGASLPKRSSTTRQLLAYVSPARSPMSSIHRWPETASTTPSSSSCCFGAACSCPPAGRPSSPSSRQQGP